MPRRAVNPPRRIDHENGGSFSAAIRSTPRENDRWLMGVPLTYCSAAGIAANRTGESAVPSEKKDCYKRPTHHARELGRCHRRGIDIRSLLLDFIRWWKKKERKGGEGGAAIKNEIVVNAAGSKIIVVVEQNDGLPIIDSPFHLPRSELLINSNSR